MDDNARCRDFGSKDLKAKLRETKPEAMPIKISAAALKEKVSSNFLLSEINAQETKYKAQERLLNDKL